MTAQITKPVWHKPVITTFAVKREGVGWLDQSGAVITDIDRVICPAAAQLKLLLPVFHFKVTDHAHEAQLNRARVANCRERQEDPKHRKTCCTVEYEGYVLKRISSAGPDSESKGVPSSCKRQGGNLRFIDGMVPAEPALAFFC